MPAFERELLLPLAQQHELTVELFQSGAFGVAENQEDFIPLKSGRLSPHYFNIRPELTPYGMRQRIAGHMLTLMDQKVVVEGYDAVDEAYDYFAGAPEAMTSFATTMADRAKFSLLQPRVATNKTTGNKAPILGRYEAEEKVALLDDVVTDGKTKVDTIEQLTSQGLLVPDYFVVVDRVEGGARQVFDETGVAITAALSVASMTRTLRDEGYLNERQFDNVAEYLEQYGDPGTVETLTARTEPF